jgi:Conserved TM helix/Mechanosensitive ion channel
MFNIQDVLLDTFKKLIDQFAEFIGNFIPAIILLVVGYFVAKLIGNLLKKGLEKAGLDKLGETLNKIDIVKKVGEIKLSAVISKTVYYFILLVFVTASTQKLGMKVLTDMVASMVALIPKLIAAAIMLTVGVLIADALKNMIISICRSLKIDSGKLLGSIIFFFFLIIATIAALKQAGIETSLLESSFNIIIGGIIMGFAIGYGIASRDILSNILSSFYSKNKFKEGQIIAVDGVKGEIISLDTTSLTLRTDATQTIIPLSILQNKKVEIFE